MVSGGLWSVASQASLVADASSVPQPVPAHVEVDNPDCLAYQRVWFQGSVLTHPADDPRMTSRAPILPGCLTSPGVPDTTVLAANLKGE